MTDRLSPRHRVHRGREAESLAASFLTLSGYEVLRRNVRFGHAEVDLVARRDRIVAFVEVRLRRNLPSAAESVVHAKRRRLLEATHDAATELEERGYRPRYDVVAMGLDRGRLILRHYRGVFAPPFSLGG